MGIAGWSNPPAERARRNSELTHLTHYAEHFSCVEINSTFYRSHGTATYARWAEETPTHFRFAVKIPRTITHIAKLQSTKAEVARFYAEIHHLQPKLAVVLVQLPPSLEYRPRIVRSFFTSLPQLAGTKVACEPRHASWFTPAADETLLRAGVMRVATDPVRHVEADRPAGADDFSYYRWHGSPRMYYSHYSQAQLTAFALQVRSGSANKSWCVFDNTARHAAWEDALQFSAILSDVEVASARTHSARKPRK